METKHTKGEWIFVSDGTSFCVFTRYELICRTHNNQNISKAQANVKLIAAAPDLLEALIDLYESLPDGYEAECLPKVRESIKKATK